MYKPKVNGYFSGGGLAELGFIQAGAEVQQSLDIDPVATGVIYANHHYFGLNHRIITADISRLTVLDQPDCDIMLFTWPCTRYSPIADIHGTRTGDELFLHGFRHLALRRPEMFWIENVPGMKKFPVVMEAITKLPDYYITVFCPVDASYWLPQRRKRLLVVGTKKEFFITPPTQINNRPRIKDILEKDPEYDIPDYVHKRVEGKYRDKPIMIDPELPGAMAPTCVAHYSKDLSTRLVKDKSAKYGYRPFTVREWARLQGCPDDFYFNCGTREAYRIIGNGVPVAMGRWMATQSIRYFNNN